MAIAADIAGLLATGQLVRAVSLKAQLQGDALTIDQSVELERHLGEIA